MNAAIENHEATEGFVRDDLQTTIALKSSFPNTKLLWVFYYNDPWYVSGYGSNTNVKAFQQFVSSMDGLMVYSSDYQGNNVSPALQSRLMNVFSQPQTALTALPAKPASNTLGWIDSHSPAGLIGGWSLDTTTPGQESVDHMCAYIDGLPGVGAASSPFVTSVYRADVNAALGTTGNHGFAWQVPSNYHGQHKVYIYGVNINGSVTQISGSPISVTLP